MNKRQDVKQETRIDVPMSWYLKMKLLGLTPNDVRDHNIGESNYSDMLIQPWSYQMANPNISPIEFDVIAYLTRQKQGESKLKTYQKVKHCIEELIRREEISEEIHKYEDQIRASGDDDENYSIGW